MKYCEDIKHKYFENIRSKYFHWPHDFFPLYANVWILSDHLLSQVGIFLQAGMNGFCLGPFSILWREGLSVGTYAENAVGALITQPGTSEGQILLRMEAAQWSVQRVALLLHRTRDEGKPFSRAHFFWLSAWAYELDHYVNFPALKLFPPGLWKYD